MSNEENSTEDPVGSSLPGENRDLRVVERKNYLLPLVRIT